MSKLRRNLDMKYKRILQTKLATSKKSALLLGPRQTGKSTLIKSMNPDISINLANEKTFLEFSSDVSLLEKMLNYEKPKTVFIDEIQRLPSLLNTIQSILDDAPAPPKFFLTGSSARKLKRGHANLLPGRIITFSMGPLVEPEFLLDVDLDLALAFGSLPGIVSEKDNIQKMDVLSSYAGTYLKEEIQAEALTKNIEGFSRFLMTCASRSGHFLDFAKLGTQASITQKTSSRFFEILEDTLIVTRIDSFTKSESRRLIQHPKFYFFDVGVLNGLLGNFKLTDDRRGYLFEHFIVNQIITLTQIYGGNSRLSTYRTESGSEVDLIIENGSNLLSLEIKATQKISPNDFKGLVRFKEFFKKKHSSMLIYGGTRNYMESSVEVLNWRTGLQTIAEFLKK